MTQRPDDDPAYGSDPAHGSNPGQGNPGQGETPVYGTPPPTSGPPGYGWQPGAPPGPPRPLGGVPEERQWALFAHLGGVLAIFPLIHLLPALLIFVIYRSRSAFVQDQAREALNFQIVVLIAFFAARILNALPLFPNLIILVWLFSLVFSVLAAVAAGKGELYRYPLTHRFLR
jgi:uncharacterized protein